VVEAEASNDALVLLASRNASGDANVFLILATDRRGTWHADVAWSEDGYFERIESRPEW